MCSRIEFKMTEGNRNVEFTLEGMGDQTQKELILAALQTFNNEPISITSQQPEPKEEKNPYEEGYKALETSTKGLHHPKSEFKKTEFKALESESIAKAKKDDIEFGVMKEKGTMKYQTFYICSSCGDKGKNFLRRSDIYVECNNCGKRMNRRDATHSGFPNQDEYGNTYIAGEFRKTLFDEEKEQKQKYA